MAERYGDELAAALPEVDAVSGFGVPVTLGRSRRRVRRPAGADARPAEPAPAALGRAVGLRQDRRGLRPDVRVLRHPLLPRPAAQPRRGVDPRRGRPAAAPSRSCWSPRTWPRYGKDRPGELGAGSIVPLVEAVRRAGRRGPGCSTSTRPICRDALIDAICATRRAVLRPLAAARVASRCCGGCGAGATVTGSSAASTTSAPASPTPRSGRTSDSTPIFPRSHRDLLD